jgi:hypothetical protein
MGQDAPPPLIRQHSRNSHHDHDQTSGKFTHTKKKNRKNLFFLSGTRRRQRRLFFSRNSCTHCRFKAAFGGVAFPKGEVLLNPYRSKKLKEKNAMAVGREKK